MVFGGALLKLCNKNEIIFVDDDPLDLDTYRRFYRRSMLTNPLVLLESGEDLLAYLAEVKQGFKAMPAMIVCDSLMPRLSGLQTLTTIRSDVHLPQNLPFIILSHLKNPEIEAAVAKIDAAGYFTKPQRVQEFDRFFQNWVT